MALTGFIQIRVVDPLIAQPGVGIIMGKETGGDTLNKGHFSPCSPVFPAQMTLLREKMTPLLEETPVSDSNWLDSACCLPGNGRLQHSYSSGSAETPAGGCPQNRVKKKSIMVCQSTIL
jgi:hypothetical protein